MTSCYSRRMDEALALVVEAFRTKCRKGSSIPYIAHLLGVAAKVAYAGGDEEQILAALLHDYLEDVPGASRELLAERFGEEVASAVEQLSDTQEHPKPPWKARKLRHLALLESAPPRVLLVWAADKLDNLESILRDHRELGPALWERFRGGRDGTLWYYRQGTDLLRRRLDHPIVAELESRLAELEARLRDELREPSGDA